MNAVWVSRLFLSAGIILVGWLLYRVVRSVSLKRAGQKGLKLVQGTPAAKTIVYFTTPDCVACISAQKPALVQLKKLLGDKLQIIEVDAYEKPELAKEWGVMSVPTTFILDEKGTAVVVNYGVTPYRKLIEQISRLV
jgi:thiol-disulfide isomerase/thioredoxin